MNCLSKSQDWQDVPSPHERPHSLTSRASCRRMSVLLKAFRGRFIASGDGTDVPQSTRIFLSCVDIPEADLMHCPRGRAPSHSWDFSKRRCFSDVLQNRLCIGAAPTCVSWFPYFARTRILSQKLKPVLRTAHDVNNHAESIPGTNSGLEVFRRIRCKFPTNEGPFSVEWTS